MKGFLMSFKDIIGQKHIIDRLSDNIKSNSHGHAYIICGPAGMGKKTLAGAFASALLCSNSSDGDMCGTCNSCILIRNGTNPDFTVIPGDEASIGVDEIRLIQRDISIRPMYSDKKAYLIYNAEKMTVQAQNCLLKTFEEPPEYGVIILTVSSPEMLLETIRSRAVTLVLKRYTRDDIYGCLIEKTDMDKEKAHFLTLYSDGILGKALELAYSKELFELREQAFEIAAGIDGKKKSDIFEVSAFFKNNREHVDFILDTMLLFYRDVLAAIGYGNEKKLINIDKKDIILDKMSVFSPKQAVKAVEIIGDIRTGMRHNANYQLSIDIMLLKLKEVFI
jgi:DNA polymerase III subunit delta'